MLLSVNAGVCAPVTSHHVLVKLLRYIQVRHANQVTAMLHIERLSRYGRKKTAFGLRHKHAHVMLLSVTQGSENKALLFELVF